jgi:uncharacterized membrane protein
MISNGQAVYYPSRHIFRKWRLEVKMFSFFNSFSVLDSNALARVMFAFFCLGFTGWAAETINESITRKCFINKGFFKGPFVPCQGLGGIAAYAVGVHFMEWPILVFLSGIVIGTAVEYLTAIFLEKCFGVKCWDYHSYPHTRWCHYKGRICLTISLFFGVIMLFVVYVLWPFIMRIADRLGSLLLVVDGVLLAAFLTDALISCMRVYKAHKEGVKLEGYAVFSDVDRESAARYTSSSVAAEKRKGETSDER